ncbi:MAG: hypothetical protein MZV65_18445 [Chromatiales bacterium]|nr:hypothetical protein [Chromatiales bacterium]
MCRNGQYTERGIKQIDGYMSERWRIEPEYAIKVDPTLGILGVLLEPTTVVAKAWEHGLRRGGPALLLGAAATCWSPAQGPIGLLAAMIGVQRGLDVHVLDRVDIGSQARSGEGPGCDVSLRRACRTSASNRTSSSSAPVSGR